MKAFASATAAGAGVVSITLFVVGAALGYGRILPAQLAFLLSALGMLLGAIATIAGVIILVRSGIGGRSGLALLGLIPALTLVYGVVSTRKAPLINDITTNRVFPPAFVHAQTLPANQGRDMAYPEAFKAQVEKGYPDLQSLGLKKSRDDVFAKVSEIATQRGWTITSNTITEKETTIEGYDVTRIFGFIDDFVIRITDASGGTVVDMRSKSRDGKGDLGANAARIRDFFAKLQS